MTFVATLAFVWFLLYWIIGGVFFACVALLRLVRLRKVRFSCLFSLSAAICAFGAAWGSTKWLEKTSSSCLLLVTESKESLINLLSCGWLYFLLSAVVGLGLLIVIGFILLKASSWKDRTWLTAFAERLEWDSEEEME